jgi:tetratricopeptide (TPR) repeat protein
VQLQRALNGSQKRGDRALERTVALELGATLVWRGFLTRAAEVLRRVLDDPALRREPTARITATLHLSQALLRQGLHAESTNRHRQALRIARKSGEKLLEGRALARLAHLHSSQGRSKLAREMLQDAFLIATEQVDTEGMNLASLQAAAQSRLVGQHNTAREELRSLLQQKEATLPLPLRAQAVSLLGDLETDRGHLDKAQEHYQRAQEMQRAIGQIYELQETLLRVADLALLQGAPQRALELGEQITLYARTQGATPLLGRAHHLTARAHIAQGSLVLAEEHLKHALGCANQSLHSDLEARTLVTWATLHRLREERSLAYSKLEKARQLQSELGTISLLSRCLLEEGHQRLQQEQPIQSLMQDLLRIADAQATMPHSALGQGLARLQRARAAQRRGDALHHGLTPGDLPENLRASAL